MNKVFSDSYLIINIIFAGIIILIFIYSGIFTAEADNHFIKSACLEIAGKPCKSIGLSRSFSEIARLKFDSARDYNPYGLKIFSFFFFQLIFRFLFSFLILKSIGKRNFIIYTDILISILLFFVTFADFLRFWEFE
jgi:hypothetical protein